MNPSVLLASALILPGLAPRSQHSGLPAQNIKVGFTEGASSTGWIPMELYLDRYIYLRGKIADVETDIVLDSGAGGTVVDSAFAAELGLASIGGAGAKGVGGDQPASLIQGLELELGGMTLGGILGVGIDLSGVGTMLGRAMPVILGKDAFHALVVDIDYPNRRVAFHLRDDFAYEGSGHSVPLVLSRDGLCTVEIELEQRAKAQVQVDTGSGGTLDVFAAFADEHGLLAERSPSSQKQAGGVGGRILSTVATLRSLSFAGYELRDVPVSFPQASEGVFATSAVDGNLGGAVFRRFRLVFDYGRKTLHVEPGPDWDTAPFRKDRLGLDLAFKGDVLEVSFVAPGSPAEKAGIRVGERIRTLGGAAVAAEGWRATFVAWADVRAGTEVAFEDAEGRTRKLVAADYY